MIVYRATVADIIEDDVLVCAGDNVEFNVAADGEGFLSYQWQLFYSGAWVDLTDNSKYSGTTTSQLTVTNAEVADSGDYRVQVFAGCGNVNSEPVKLDINVIIASIGTPAPFMINPATTGIEVGIKVNGHFLIFDMGFALVAPDGTEVMLKSPEPDPCVYNSPVNINATFNNALTSADTMNYCVASGNITGTFGAAGDWSVLNGMDPSNGAWQIRVYDQDKAVADPDGYLTGATLLFTDLDQNGDTAVVTYNSGVISQEILNPIAGELRPTSYIVPIRLSTSCFNTEDAKAVVTVDGGVAPFTFEWSGPTPEADSDEADLGPGIYTVTVTDAIGCTAVASVEVTAPPVIVFDNVQHTDTIVCFGDASGVIRAKASGGSGSITYKLLPGNIISSVADSGVFMNLAAGAYTVRATDLNGCSFDTIIRIEQHTELLVNIVTVPVIGSGTGSITLTASGGVPPYQYSIDNGTTLQDNGVFDSLVTGIYPVYVVDATGCIFTASVNLNVELLNVDVTVHDVSCNGLADGSFYLALIDGAGPFTLTGSFTDTLTLPSGAFSFTGQTAGSYDVKIEDSEGRIFIDTIEISEPVAIIASANITDATCSSGTQDGAIDITVSGGSGVFTYGWSNGTTTEDVNGVVAGFYSVVISDENGCNSGEFEFEIEAETYVSAFAGNNQLVCPGLKFNLSGSAGDSVEWWPDVFVTHPNSTFTEASIPATTVFTYTVYDLASGCEASDTVKMIADVVPEIEIFNSFTGEPLDSVIYLAQGDSAIMYASIGFQNYLWSPDMYIDNANSIQVIIRPPEDISYRVYGYTVTGCRDSAFVHVILRRPVKIYTGFSPNGDEYNPVWVIENAEQWGDKIHVRVFNRWGELIFESKGYGGDAAWDGTRNGKLMPVGSYYYIIDIKDGISKPYTGTVTILR